MSLFKTIALRKIMSLSPRKGSPLQYLNSKTDFNKKFLRKFSHAYFDLLCCYSTILNQKISESDEDHLPNCCNGILETINTQNRVESGQIGIIYVHFDRYQNTKFDHLNIRNIFSSEQKFYVDFGVDILEKYWIESKNPILFIFSSPDEDSKHTLPYKIKLSGILLNTYFEEKNITKTYINSLRSQNIYHICVQINHEDDLQKLNVNFLNSIKFYKNSLLIQTNTYYSQQKIHDENQQIGRFGEQFVKYRCFEYGYLVKNKTYDFGIDFMFYTFDENRMLDSSVGHFQIKSQKKCDIRDGFVHKSIKSKDIETWINYLGPVFLIIVDVSTHLIYWTFIDSSTKLNKSSTTTLKIPTSNGLDESGLETIKKIKNQFY